MKTILSTILLSFALCIPAFAQLGTNTTVAVGAVGGVVYTPLNGGTNNIAANTTVSTITNVTVPVAQHPNVGVEVIYNCWTGATNGNFILNLAKSYDNGNTYETTPSISLTNALPTALQFAAGKTNFVVDFDLSVPNATFLQTSSMQNTATGGNVTNVQVIFNLNNQTVWNVPAQR